MPRALLEVTDSIGIGGEPDVGDFFIVGKPDIEFSRLTHIAQVAGPLGMPSARWEIFAMLGITDVMTEDDTALMEHLGDAMEGIEDGGLVFATSRGLIRSMATSGVCGAARGRGAVRRWDRADSAWLCPRDLMVVTADQGSDPTWPGRTTHGSACYRWRRARRRGRWAWCDSWRGGWG